MRHLPVRLLARIKSKNILALVFLTLFLSILVGTAKADTIAKTFGADKNIAPGYVVMLSGKDLKKVELANNKELSRIYGVVIDPLDSPITLQTGNGQVVVSTSGSYSVFASASGGAIKIGDYLSLSTTDGVAAKASVDQGYIIGRALGDFDGNQGVASGNGSKAIGKIAIQISPGKNPLSKSDPSVPGPLLRIANSIAGKPVTAARVYSAVGIFLVSLIVASGLIYVGIRASLISIGRNPLSKHSIMRGLLQVVLSAALVFGGGLLGVYLLVRI